MLNQQSQLDRTFHALADQARRSMVAQLSERPRSVGELAKPLAMSLPAVLQHLSVLENAGLVRSEKIGRVRTCRIEPQALTFAEQWLNAHRLAWEQRLDRLADYLETKQQDGADNVRHE